MTVEAPPPPAPSSMIWAQFRYHNKVFWRTPIAAFFTIVFPLMLLVLFTALFGNEEIPALGITTAQYYAPGLAVFSAVSASYTNLAINTAMARDNGILKRIRGTPVPAWVYMGSKVASAVYLAAVSLILMMAVGIVFYGVELIPRTLPAAALTFIVGVACFSALGLLVAAVTPNGDAAPAITNATLLPIAFISDIFIVMDNSPAWMRVLGDIFPLKPFAVAFRDAFDPTLAGAQLHWPELGQMALWGVIAAVLAIRLFKWEPRTDSRRSRRRLASPPSADGGR